MNQTIRQWIARAQQGEEEAVLLILQQFRPLICKYARRHRYCYDSLDEAVSVAQLAILECVHSFDLSCDDEAHKEFRRAVDRVFKRESRRFKTYMASMETARHVDESAEALGLLAGDEQDPHRLAVVSEVRELVRKCLDSLTEEEQRFLRLRCQHDLIYSDVAKRCGLSLSQAHKLTKAAMIKFYEAMGCHGGGEGEVYGALRPDGQL
ncbi:sigma-70 family RNA polymerase sigma factor [Megasphaera stantonii]|uniref:sigma-70 family RNA polymerase sigma factor n=1 Tax=Megasphaera stantonii TaxID=2144175 RepID=UPI001DD97CD4|nr:sigma-70 family RNA polymerase sigma factor [Megasphaera stantonii]HJE82983.1 sigma-70 family RNA polymerase sigma factor [Megasphaera stantonii]